MPHSPLLSTFAMALSDRDVHEWKGATECATFAA